MYTYLCTDIGNEVKNVTVFALYSVENLLENPYLTKNSLIK